MSSHSTVDSKLKNYQATAQRARSISKAIRDIGKPPAVVDPHTREACARDLQAFCECYHEDKFTLDWSDDHLKAIRKLQSAILNGGKFAFAMPRGSGKTTLTLCAAEWAILYGHRKWVVIISATAPDATNLLVNLRTDLENNQCLFDDFPEVCHPLREIAGQYQKARGQTMDGDYTHCEVKVNKIALPQWRDSISFGGRVTVGSITASMRGKVATLVSGESIRPDFAICDDPQTDESARSFAQTANRETTIKRVVLGLAGPGETISCVIPCTIIEHDDLAFRLLDTQRNPEFQGEISELLYTFPTNTELWDSYATMRADGFRSGDDGTAATEFYVLNREAMSVGARVGWPARFNKGEVDALQHCMNLYLADPAGFNAEYRNRPEERTKGNANAIAPEHVTAKLTGQQRCTMQPGTTRITAAVDCHANIMFYTVTAWDEYFNGTVIDYGTYPKQNRPYFTQVQASPNLADEFTGNEASRIYYGLSKVCELVLGHHYGDMRVERCFIDSGRWADIVLKFCAQSPYNAILTPSKGYGVAAGSLPMSEWPKKTGEKAGWNWRARATTGGGKGRIVLFDSNSWKTKLREMLVAPFGSPGCLGIFGDAKTNHELFIDHFRSEFPHETSGRGRTLWEWKQGLSYNDNHWFDCVVMTLVAVEYTGLQMGSTVVGEEVREGAKPLPIKPREEQHGRRKKVTYEEIMRRRNASRPRP